MTKRAAIIMASGAGTRFLPAAKSINKCMMPVQNKPVLQYAVEECVDAGIDQIVILVTDGDDEVRNHFKQDAQLRRRLELLGKEAVYDELVKPMSAYEDKLRFAEQPDDGTYGTAIAVKWGLTAVDNDMEQVFIMNGDGIIATGEAVVGEAQAAIRAMEQSSLDGILIGDEVPFEDRARYGVFIQNEEDPDLAIKILEKPAPEVAPESRLANLGWYILPRPQLEEYIARTQKDEKSQEYYITDTVSLIAKDYRLGLHKIEGTFLDCGTPEKWLAANNYLADQETTA